MYHTSNCQMRQLAHFQCSKEKILSCMLYNKNNGILL